MRWGRTPAARTVQRLCPCPWFRVVFVTLEDETGSINAIVWRDVGEAQRRELLGARLLAVHGVLERQGEVVHLIAKRLVDHSVLLGKLATSNRDFH